MQDLIKNIVAKVGVTEEQAAKTIHEVLAALKAKMPDFLHVHLDNAANGESLVDSLKDEAGELLNKMKGKGEELLGKGEELLGELKEKFAGTPKQQ